MPSLSANDKLKSNAIRASVNITRYEASVKKQVVAQLEKLRKELVAEIADKATKTAFSQARLAQLLKVTDDTINSTYAGIASSQEVELASLMATQAGITKSMVNAAAGFSILDTTYSDVQLKTLASNVMIEGAPSAEWWARAGKGMRENFTDNIRQGMLKGETMDEMVARVQGPGGIMAKSTRQAEALVRTSVQTAANTMRDQVIKDNQDIFDGIQWVSTLDGNTTEICMGLDGLVWDNNMEPVDHDQPFPGPTAHWGCRSTQIPVLKAWSDIIKDEDLAKKLDAAEAEDPGTRASMDGQVSAKLNYEDWLKTQPESVQQDILGPGKWQLWQDGKLN